LSGAAEQHHCDRRRQRCQHHAQQNARKRQPPPLPVVCASGGQDICGVEAGGIPRLAGRRVHDPPRLAIVVVDVLGEERPVVGAQATEGRVKGHAVGQHPE
jgi:hypothetical protein